MLEEAGFVSAHGHLPKAARITWPSNGRFPDATFDAYSDHRPVVVDFSFNS